MTRVYLSQKDIAELLGVSPGTVRKYTSQGRLPDPDVIIGEHEGMRGWKRETIDQWQASRPGHGGRPRSRG